MIPYTVLPPSFGHFFEIIRWKLKTSWTFFLGLNWSLFLDSFGHFYKFYLVVTVPPVLNDAFRKHAALLSFLIDVFDRIQFALLTCPNCTFCSLNLRFWQSQITY